jgi:cobalt/nickel transport system permease protein
MHLGNGAITPACAAVTCSVAAVGVGVAVAAARKVEVDRGRIATAGALGAAVFAAQMINVPVLPFSSAHLVGGVLLAWALGPALGVLTMATILVVQAFLLGDGGLIALGANIVNMALVPAVVVLAARRVFGPARNAIAVSASAALSVVAAAILIVGEVALFRGGQALVGIGDFAWQMIWTHALIGLGEAALTAAVLLALGGAASYAKLRLDGARLAITSAAAFVLAAVVMPIASRMPDGYESAVEMSGLGRVIESIGGFNAVVHAWQNSIATAVPGSEIVVAVAATILTGLVALGLASLVRTAAFARERV